MKVYTDNVILVGNVYLQKHVGNSLLVIGNLLSCCIFTAAVIYNNLFQAELSDILVI